jgi:glycosyltransferase involved in cell wall biosynthesis
MVEKLVLIAGMHRSGTSLVTRLCNLLGADIGGEMLAPTPDNPKGYWENKRSFEIHEALFTLLGMPWNGIGQLPEGWVDGQAAETTAGALVSLLDEEFKGPLAVIKDPKICRLLPLWQRIGTAQKIEPHVVLALRHPLAVAGSLARRDGMGEATALLLWLRHTVEAERDSRDVPRVIFDYDAAMADWRGETQKLIAGLGIDWPKSLDDIAGEVEGFISPELRHNAGETAETPLAQDCVALYEALLKLKPGGKLPAKVLAAAEKHLGVLDQAGAVLDEMGWAHLRALGKAEYGRQLEAELRREIEKRDQELVSRGRQHQEQVDNYNKVVAAREQELAEFKEYHAEQVANLQQTVSTHEAQIELMYAHLTHLQNEIAAMVNSRSWRITRPLREINGWRRQKLPHYKYLLTRLFYVLKEGDFKTLKRAIDRRLSPTAGQIPATNFGAWVAKFDTFTDEDRAGMRARFEKLEDKPLISILMPVYKPPVDVLRQALQSVKDQVYTNWELCIVDDGAGDKEVIALLEAEAAAEPRIRLQVNAHNQNISGATNDAFALASGEFTAFMDHDDLLQPHALLMVAEALAEHPDADVLYSDEDKVDRNNIRFDPNFKPAWNRDLFYAQNYLNHLTVIRSALIGQAGGWRLGFEGSQDYDLLLRVIEHTADERIVHIPHILYHWRAIETSAAGDIGSKNEAALAGERALREHLERLGKRVEVGPGAEDYGLAVYYRVKYLLPDPPPRVSLIVPTKDKIELLKGCVDGLLHKTDYPDLEVLIVDNNSEEQASFDYFAEVQKDSRVRVLRYEEPFNFSAINNFAAKQATGLVLGLINNDIEVIHPNWLAEMVGHALRPEIGCVGAKLYYADNRVQHAGVICGLGGAAGHSHKYYGREWPGYFGRLGLLQQFSAVTAACLLIRREVYEEVNGLDESFAVAFNDVDFCLRVLEAGYRNLFTPYAELYHLESVSRGQEDTPEKVRRFHTEVSRLRGRWNDFIANDPAYSPNLTIQEENFALADPPRTYRPWSVKQWPGMVKFIARQNLSPVRHDTRVRGVGDMMDKLKKTG